MIFETSSIHPSALVHPQAEIDGTATVGPFALIGAHVRLGPQVRVGAHAVIDGWTQIGAACTIYPHAALGLAPQDLKYQDEPTRLILGQGNTVREFSAFHRGTVDGGGETIIGDDNFFMAYTHVAHDCHVGCGVIMANAATLGGHVEVGDHVILGGLAAVHQHTRIGAYAMIGGGAIVVQDVPPYVNVAGNRARMYGLNLIGLRRRNFSKETVSALKGVYRLLFRSAGLTMVQRTETARARWGACPEAEVLIAFVEASDRGVCQGRWEKRGGLLS